MQTCGTCHGARMIGCDKCRQMGMDLCKGGNECPDDSGIGDKNAARFCPTCVGRGIIISNADIANMERFAEEDGYFNRYIMDKHASFGFSVHDMRGIILIMDDTVKDDGPEKRVALASRFLVSRRWLMKHGGTDIHAMLGYRRCWHCCADFSIPGLILLINVSSKLSPAQAQTITAEIVSDFRNAIGSNSPYSLC